LLDHLADSALFAARFREAAGRSLLLPRRRPGSRTPLWLQRRRAAGLMSVAKQFGTFPIVLETYREILQDDFDLEALTGVLGDLRSRRTRVVDVELGGPSPFASSLLFAFVAAYMYEADTPLAERRAAALTLDRDLLRELLGEGELRQLLAADVIAAVEVELQRLIPERAARSLDAVADMLRHLGPLTTEGVDLRTTDLDPEATLKSLEADRRVIRVHISGEERWAAIEDAARLRDALGVQPPAGVPYVFLEPVDDPLADVVRRYARTHAPFRAEDVAKALRLAPPVVDKVLPELEAGGRLLHGAFTPGRAGIEWVDAEVLRAIKRRSLAELRGEIEPVDEEALGRFLAAWQGVGQDRTGRSAALEVLNQL